MNSWPVLASLAQRSPCILLAWTFVLAFLFAKLEIQIEGPHGWAANLPTWRLSKSSRLRWLFGGRQITGYHAYAFAFMAAAFHLPPVLFGQFSFAVEARILASLASFWMVEDFLWFAFNPAFGLAKFRREHVPWHPHWVLGVPVDYLVMMAAATALYAYSYWPRPPLPA